jgi:hypothetical protein
MEIQVKSKTASWMKSECVSHSIKFINKSFLFFFFQAIPRRL